MIIDSLSNLSKYTSAYPQLTTVAQILDSGILSTAECGYHATDDPNVRYNVIELNTHEKGIAGYEVHHSEADVQIVLSGAERMDLADPDSLTPRDSYNPDGDFQFFDGCLLSTFHALHGSFVLYLPGDAHEPCLCDPEPSHVRKVVFKLKF